METTKEIRKDLMEIIKIAIDLAEKFHKRKELGLCEKEIGEIKTELKRLRKENFSDIFTRLEKQKNINSNDGGQEITELLKIHNTAQSCIADATCYMKFSTKIEQETKLTFLKTALEEENGRKNQKRGRKKIEKS
jgi:hypothetical protein